MDINEKFAKAQEKMEEFKTEFASTLNSMKELQKEENQADIAKMKADMEVVSAELQDYTDKKSAEFDAKVEALIARNAAAKEKIRKFGEELDKADMEDYIDELLTYSEDCRDLADAFMEESDLAFDLAKEQIAIYNEKYGE